MSSLTDRIREALIAADWDGGLPYCEAQRELFLAAVQPILDAHEAEQADLTITGEAFLVLDDGGLPSVTIDGQPVEVLDADGCTELRGPAAGQRCTELSARVDPTLLALGGPKGFSAIWMQPTNLPPVHEEWQPPPAWLGVETGRLGQAFLEYARTNATSPRRAVSST